MGLSNIFLVRCVNIQKNRLGIYELFPRNQCMSQKHAQQKDASKVQQGPIEFNSDEKFISMVSDTTL